MKTIKCFLRASIALGLLAAAIGTAMACSRSNIVFFDAGSADINKGARKALESLTAEFAPLPGPDPTECRYTITIHSHLDKAEGAQPTSRLDTERAEAIQTTLLNMGWPSVRFVVVAKRDSQPLVPTRPGTAEAQNRRVEMFIKLDVKGRIACKGDPGSCDTCVLVLPSGQRCPVRSH